LGGQGQLRWGWRGDRLGLGLGILALVLGVGGGCFGQVGRGFWGGRVNGRSLGQVGLLGVALGVLNGDGLRGFVECGILEVDFIDQH
jgi:hypothetical protein